MSDLTVQFLKIAFMTVGTHFYSKFVAKSILKGRTLNFALISLRNTLIKNDFIVTKKSHFENHEKL
jgi:hypothetical protein